ncbi:DUF2784 domain-containing protein [Caballeronia ptereochthonis]|nr:DUF2784 domain-containing protein [Caballeronia ptereochthonis]
MIWLADIVLMLHALTVLFIVGGLIAIWLGAAFKRTWARNRAFRMTHMVAIGIVAALALLDLPCPLTVLEGDLRSGHPGAQGFLQHWISAWLYLDLPIWVFILAYSAFFLIVVATWRRFPPRS